MFKEIIFPGNCIDIDSNATDLNGYGCDAYMTSASCKNYDDHDFSSSEMCCMCGGGRFGNTLNVIAHYEKHNFKSSLGIIMKYHSFIMQFFSV